MFETRAVAARFIVVVMFAFVPPRAQRRDSEEQKEEMEGR